MYHDLFADWLPTGEMEPDGVPVAVRGVRVLADVSAVLADHRGSDGGHRLADALESLAYANDRYLRAQNAPGRDISERRLRYDECVGEVERRMSDIEERTRALSRERSDGVAEAGAE